MDDAFLRGQVVEGRRVLEPDQVLALARRCSYSPPSSASRQPPSRRPYSASGSTAAATFAGSVHGVVVQTTSDSPSRSFSGKRTYSDGCSSSR